DERLWILAKGHDVDLLGPQFVHQHLNARTTLADARTDGVDTLVVADDSDLAPLAGFARDGLDLDEPLSDFGDLHLQELAEQVRVAAAHDDLEAPHGLLDLEDIDAKPLVG